MPVNFIEDEKEDKITAVNLQPCTFSNFPQTANDFKKVERVPVWRRMEGQSVSHSGADADTDAEETLDHDMDFLVAGHPCSMPSPPPSTSFYFYFRFYFIFYFIFHFIFHSNPVFMWCLTPPINYIPRVSTHTHTHTSCTFSLAMYNYSFHCCLINYANTFVIIVAS